MPPVRTAALALCAAALALPGAAHAQSGGAGDQQYADPFGAQTSGGKPRAGKTPPPPSASNGLSQSPDLGASGSQGTTGSTGAPPSHAPATAPGQLPNTGHDPRLLTLAGLALLLAGIGLRLRSADETF